MPYHTETAQLIYPANQLTGFYLMGPVDELMSHLRMLATIENDAKNEDMKTIAFVIPWLSIFNGMKS